MKINLGKEFFSVRNGNPEEIGIDYTNIVNPHMVLVGPSGTGKTYSLRKIVNAIISKNNKTRFHILDVHGDIETVKESVVKFSETTNYGLQPLKLSSDPDFGGVRKKIRSFIRMLNQTNRKLGPKQETVLYHLLEDLYYARKFDPKNPKTWTEQNGRKYPSLLDLKRWTEYKYKHMLFGAPSKALKAFDELKKLNAKLQRKIKQSLKDKESEKLKEEIVRTKEEMKESFAKGVDALGTGYELDELIKYDSPDVVKSVLDRISLIESSGIFKETPPPFEENKNVWRYDVKSLSRDEQRMFLSVLAEDIFLDAKEKGQRIVPDKFIVVDEASIFLENTDGEYILNIIAKEARKFGLGLVLATQSLEHIPNDIIESSATKIILGVSEEKMDITAKKLQIDKKKLKYIQPRKSAIVQIKEGGKQYSPYQNVILDIK
jgi:type IV secretory pathway VirB4 component